MAQARKKPAPARGARKPRQHALSTQETVELRKFALSYALDVIKLKTIHGKGMMGWNPNLREEAAASLKFLVDGA